MNLRGETSAELGQRKSENASQQRTARGRLLKDDKDWLRGSVENEEANIKVSEDEHPAKGNMRNLNKIKTNPKEILSSTSANENKSNIEAVQEMVIEDDGGHPNNIYTEHHQRQHTPGCVVSKLVGQNNDRSGPQMNTGRMVKRHLPHCVHNHSHNCPKHQHQHQHQHQKLVASYLGPEHEPDGDPRSRSGPPQPTSNSATVVRNKNTTYRQLKYYKQPDKYLLVEYRPSQDEFHPAGHVNGERQRPHYNNPDSRTNKPENVNTGKRNTIKFISQLYFLLHLSAILSLLLHHKSLLAAERRLLAKQAFMQQQAIGASQRHHNIRKHLVSGTHSPSVVDQPIVVSSEPPPHELPVPQKLLLLNKQAALNVSRPHSSVVGSVIVSTNSQKHRGHSEHTGNATRNRFGRQVEQQPIPIDWPKVQSTDILVELLGYWHAKCAIQYFLCYLLSSSVTILVCIRLCRMCRLGKKRKLKEEPESNWRNLSNYGFYYRTRLDCTPVLIGSISLGLIQLIVIGLEVVNNVDWLSGEGRHWPIYLPSLQFAFVSLLMQFILSKVAKNHEQKEAFPVAVSGVVVSSRPKRRQAFSINQQPSSSWSNKKEVGLPENNATRGWSWWKVSNGFQNIALAHLLVTHILLWLMKLNSISLFQSIEHQPAHFKHPNELPFGSISVASTNLDNLQFSTSDSSPELNFVAESSSPNEPIELAEPTATEGGLPGEEPANRTELESILRRKPANVTASETRTPPNVNHLRPTGNEQKRLEASGGGNSQVLLADKPVEPSLREPGGPLSDSSLELAAIKNERGLRSASVKSTILRDQNLADGFPWALDNTTVRMSHAQLMRLLSMAASGQTRLSAPQPNTTSSPPIVQPNTIFKSSLPKRMTAFRQASAKQSTTNSSQGDFSIQPTTSTTVAPKQRARIIISHLEPEPAPEDAKSFLNKKPPAGVPGSSERPFPSMELAGQAARDKATVASQESHSRATTTTTTTTKLSSGLERPIQVVRGKPIFNETKEPASVPQVKQTPLSPPPAIVENEVDQDSDDADGDSSDDDDSTFQLPPVPNYNDTTGDEETSSAGVSATEVAAGQREFPIMRKPRVLIPDDRKKDSNKTVELKEQALVFNEAASAVEPTVTKAPKLASNATEETIKNETATLPKPEAQMMPPNRKQAEFTFARRNQPTFADYLLPIVHQYHILIIAILFNMWLDSLRKGNKQISIESGRLVRANRRLRDALGSGSSSGSDFSSDLKFLGRERRNMNRIQQNHRSRSANSLHKLDDRDSSGSTLSRYNSLRSSSSQRQLLWIPSSHVNNNHHRHQPASGKLQKWEMPPFTSMTYHQQISASPSETLEKKRANRPKDSQALDGSNQTHPVCSVFFGLLVVSGSLIVMILGIDLLSVLAQCTAQLISILVCLLGLCFICKFRGSESNQSQRASPGKELKNLRFTSKMEPSKPSMESHRQCFHYLFLLAAYYCGISIALNLTRQYSIQHLFSQQVIQFGQRYLNQWTNSHWLARQGYNQNPAQATNYLFLFHVILALKGLLLILQVTLQTILIRSSCQRATRDLRQIYTFLMFANLSLWAMEICEQQQHLQNEPIELKVSEKSWELMTLDSFTRFAASIVTLSHLYHGLVFMQH